MTTKNRSDKSGPEIINNQTGKIEDTPAPRRIDLSSLRDVRLELAYLYRMMDAGEIQTQDGTRRAYVLKTIHDVIVSVELERRIAELEERQLLSGGIPALPYRHTAAH